MKIHFVTDYFSADRGEYAERIWIALLEHPEPQAYCVPANITDLDRSILAALNEVDRTEASSLTCISLLSQFSFCAIDGAFGSHMRCVFLGMGNLVRRGTDPLSF